MKIKDTEKPYCANFSFSAVERESLAHTADANLFRTHEFMNFEDHPEVNITDFSIDVAPSFNMFQACKRCGYRPDKQYVINPYGRFVLAKAKELAE